MAWDRLSRREALWVGALGSVGLSLPQLLRAEAASAPARQKSVLLIVPWGGPGRFSPPKWLIWPALLTLLRPRPIIESQDTLHQLYTTLFGNEITEKNRIREVVHSEPEVEECDVWLVVDRLMASRHADRFASLYFRGDLSDYHHDHSRADLGLCGLLAPYCDFDADLIDAVFRKSALHRPKVAAHSVRRVKRLRVPQFVI